MGRQETYSTAEGSTSMPANHKISLRKRLAQLLLATGQKIQAIHDINFDVEDAFTPDGRDLGDFASCSAPPVAVIDHPSTDRRP